MRRAELSRKMDVQQKNLLQAHLANSEFYKKLLGLPIINAAVCFSGDAYVKVKDSNALVRRSIELAENNSTAVAVKLAPIAEKGINVASPLTTKVDAIAAASLDGLIARVPVISEEPKEIVQNTRSAIEKQVTVLNGYTEAALKTWPVQKSMDIYESILTTAYNTLVNVLPPTKDEKADSNGYTPTKESVGEQDKHKRGIMLAHMTYLVFSKAVKRVFGICQTQVENAAHVTDAMYKQVRNTASDDDNNTTPTTTTTQDENVTNNGDVNKQASSNNKKGKKKNNQE